MKTIITIWLLAMCAIGGDTTMTGPLCEYRTRVKNTSTCNGPVFCSEMGGVTSCPAICNTPDSLEVVWQAPCKGGKP